MGALLAGRLDGDPRTGCLWVTSTRDREVRQTVKWPSKYKIVGGPLRLVDERGNEVARVGDFVHVGGGSGGRHTRVDPECKVSRGIFIAHDVERVESPG